jgi:DNA-3-methyladenine glycosylase II
VQLPHQEQSDHHKQQGDSKPSEARGLPIRAFLVVIRRETQPHNPGHGTALPLGWVSAVRRAVARAAAMTKPCHAAPMRAAIRHLRAACPRLDGLIHRIGPCGLAPERQTDPYEALVRAIAFQQLHGNAARAILGRFVALYPGIDFPTPAMVLATEPAAMRACGFSAGKIAAIRDIAAHAAAGVVPTRRAAARLSDAALIERLTAIRGVGRWTVEMLLIFTLGRPDVLPVDDFGVREGYRRLHGLDAQPKPKELGELGLIYAPYRSFAAWYLWRCADEGKAVQAQGKAP